MVFTGLLPGPQALLSCGLKVGPGKVRASEMHILFGLFSPKFCHMKIYGRLYLYFPSKSGNVVEGRGLEVESVHNKCPFG